MVTIFDTPTVTPVDNHVGAVATSILILPNRFNWNAPNVATFGLGRTSTGLVTSRKAFRPTPWSQPKLSIVAEMKINQHLLVLFATMAFVCASALPAQEFGAIRPALPPIVSGSSHFILEELAQDKSKQDAPLPTIQVPDRPDERTLPEIAVIDEPQQHQRTEFGQWPAKKISDIQIDIREMSDNAPEDRSAELIGFSSKQWTEFTPTPKVFAWAAPDIRYQPLYFEDVALERYGQTLPPYRQSVLSAWHYTKSFLLAPNKMFHDPVFSCDYPLGFCRPGDKVDYTLQRQYLGHPRR